MTEVNHAVRALDQDKAVGAIVITGSKKAFAAGADIKEMSPKTFADVYTGKMFSSWEEMLKASKPIIAAVNGYALGGGCELAMSCDIILAGDKAQFGQPELKLGTIPGYGGTQRLTRAIGKYRAMEMILTCESINAETAEKWGLAARVFPEDQLLDRAVEMAAKIASFSKPIAAMAKECVNKAEELPLTEGVQLERRVFYSTFATKDQKEGMGAFVNKAKPKWQDM
jgi:enoyl-CoA hydratase/carnithine racemase